MRPSLIYRWREAGQTTSIASRSRRPGIASETEPHEFAAKPRCSWPVTLLSTLCTLLFLTGGVMAQAGWHHNDLTSGAGGAQAAASDPAGYMFNAQNTQHVVYPGTDNRIHELWWNSSGWHHNNLTNVAGGAPAAASDPAGYMFNAQNTQHVVYRGTDNHIHELWWNSSGWHHNDLTNAAGNAPAAAGDPAGYMFDAQGTQHVVYRGTDNHIHELWWN
jgi:hypothetical protein